MGMFKMIADSLKKRYGEKPEDETNKEDNEYNHTETEGELLYEPDIYIKYLDDNQVRLLFTNKNNEWSEFEALYPSERETYIQDMTKIVLYLSSLHDELLKFETKLNSGINIKKSAS